MGVRSWNGEEQVVGEEEEGGKDLYHQTSQSQPNLINSSSAGCGVSAGVRARGQVGEERTFEFVFAYVDGGWGFDYVGREVVDHCRCCGGFNTMVRMVAEGRLALRRILGLIRFQSLSRYLRLVYEVRRLSQVVTMLEFVCN